MSAGTRGPMDNCSSRSHDGGQQFHQRWAPKIRTLPPDHGPGISNMLQPQPKQRQEDRSCSWLIIDQKGLMERPSGHMSDPVTDQLTAVRRSMKPYRPTKYVSRHASTAGGMDTCSDGQQYLPGEQPRTMMTITTTTTGASPMDQLTCLAQTCR